MSKLIEKILLEGMEKFTPLPLKLLHLLDEWISYYNEYDEILSVELKKECALSLPQYFKKPLSNELYRTALTPKKNITNLFFKNGVRSWSTSLKQVQSFGFELKDNGDSEEETAVIFRTKIEPIRIVCNLEALLRSDLFNKSYMFYREQKQVDFHTLDIDLANLFEEIIYDQPSCKFNDVILISNDQYQWVSPQEYIK